MLRGFAEALTDPKHPPGCLAVQGRCRAAKRRSR
jgi:hypothetical protein